MVLFPGALNNREIVVSGSVRLQTDIQNYCHDPRKTCFPYRNLGFGNSDRREWAPGHLCYFLDLAIYPFLFLDS